MNWPNRRRRRQTLGLNQPSKLFLPVGLKGGFGRPFYVWP